MQNAHGNLPDYTGGSILNLMASIAHALDARDWPFAPLRELSVEQLRTHRNIVLLVVDGLGWRYLQQHPSCHLLTHLQGAMTSVFPSTTASAITTFLTGLPPSQHGLTGWHMYLDEVDAIAAILPFQTRATQRPLRSLGVDAQAMLGGRSLFDALQPRCMALVPHHICNSEFNVAHCGSAQRLPYRSLTQFFDTLLRCLDTQGTRRFVYAYWPELDSAAHEQGIASPRTSDVLLRFDHAFQRFVSAARGSDTTLILTADHGFIDSTEASVVQLTDHPQLAATLSRPLCGERRVAYCYVEPQRREHFEAYVGEHLAQQAELHSSQALIEAGWFGPGPMHPKLAQRVGDYVLLMKPPYTIKDWLPGEKPHRLIGVHGGISEQEMMVPLVVVEL